MDAEGEVLATHEGPRTVEAFRQTTAGAQRYATLKAVKDPTPQQRVDLFLAELDLGKLDLAAARQRRTELTGLTPEQETKVSQALTDLEILDMAQALGQRPSPQQRAELGGRYHAMLQEGRRPTGEQAFQPFYILMLDWAEQQKNAAAFEQALGALRERFGSQPGVDRFFKAQEERLQRIKGQ